MKLTEVILSKWRITYLPFRKYKFEIHYSPSEFENLLKTELKKNEHNLKGFIKTNKIVFRGIISNRIFKLYRRGFGNTSLIPILDGKITNCKNNNNAYIEINIRYHTLVNAFLSVWFGIIMIIFLAVSILSIINWNFNIVALISLGMLLIPYSIIMLTFLEEVKTIKRFLYESWYIKIE